MFKKILGGLGSSEQFAIPEHDSPLFKDIQWERLPRHVAVIMDGNGRWATGKGLLRTAGHKAGVKTLKNILKTAIGLKLDALTVYAFSTENWKRPRPEVDFLMQLFSDYLTKELQEMHEDNVQIHFLGRIEGLPAVQKLAAQVAAGKLRPEDITEQVFAEELDTRGNLPVDLVIRTSGDERLSNFLLWQSAYAEFYFTDVNWPDFTPADFVAAMVDFAGRNRRFGGLQNK